MVNSVGIENLLYEILDEVPASIYCKDLEGRYTLCNRFMLKMSGFNSRDEILGKRDAECPWSAIHEALEEIDDEVMSKQIVHETEEYPKIHTGEIRCFLTRKKPLIANNEVVGLIGVSIDITEKKESEKKLMLSLQNEREANKMKSDFIANISHDLRTPLSGILMALDCAKREEDPNKLREILEAAELSGDSLIKFVNSILLLIETEVGGKKNEEITFSLSELLGAFPRTYSASLLGKPVNFELDFPDSLPRAVIGQRLTLERAVNNILSNAIKFTEKGFIKISLQFLDEQQDSVICLIKIQDTGIGISEDYLGKIFDPFYKIKASYKKNEYSGNGLGLFACKKSIEQLGGSIEIESEKGVGTTVSLTIPFKRSRSNEELDLNVEKDLAPQSFQECGGETFQVLLVEDTNIVSIMAKRQLETISFQVDAVGSGEEAIEYAETKSYDLIIMDIGLPGICGREAAKQIRINESRLEDSTRSVIIGFTAHTDKRESDLCRLAGMDDVILKPLTIKKCLQLYNLFVEPGLQPI